jgi:hypothetical protein
MLFTGASATATAVSAYTMESDTTVWAVRFPRDSSINSNGSHNTNTLFIVAY